MFAQLTNTAPEHVKDFILIGIALFGVVALAWGMVKKNTTTVAPDPLRVQKADGTVSREFCAQIHGDTTRRLDGHDKDIRDIYAELKRDREANENHASARSSAIYGEIRKVSEEMNRGFRDVERTLGRLETKLSSDGK